MKKNTACYAPCVAAEDVEPDGGRQQRAEDMAWKERLMHTLHLWPYMLPLCVVYFAEYAMQTGTWTAIGLPSWTAVSADCTPWPWACGLQPYGFGNTWTRCSVTVSMAKVCLSFADCAMLL